jgi:ferredoxin, 2Fe-2S
MARIRFIQIDGAVIDADTPSGGSLMQLALERGVTGIEAICGGSCSCGTCHLYIADPWIASVGSPAPDEALLLRELTGVRANSRLGCQIKITEALDGLTVTVAQHSDDRSR